MAKINNGHFGSFQGKLGAVTGRKMKGQFYIHQSITHNRSNTNPQQAQRAKFKAATLFCRHFANIVKFTYADFDVKQENPMNAFMRYTLRNSMAEPSQGLDGKWVCKVQLPKVMFSQGSYEKLHDAVITSASVDAGVKISWDKSEMGLQGLSSDFVNIVLVNESKLLGGGEGIVELVFDSTVTRGITAGSATLAVPSSWDGDEVHVFCWCTNQTSGKDSPCQYLGIASFD